MKTLDETMHAWLAEQSELSTAELTRMQSLFHCVSDWVRAAADPEGPLYLPQSAEAIRTVLHKALLDLATGRTKAVALATLRHDQTTIVEACGTFTRLEFSGLLLRAALDLEGR